MATRVTPNKKTPPPPPPELPPPAMKSMAAALMGMLDLIKEREDLQSMSSEERRVKIAEILKKKLRPGCFAFKKAEAILDIPAENRQTDTVYVPTITYYDETQPISSVNPCTLFPYHGCKTPEEAVGRAISKMMLMPDNYVLFADIFFLLPG